MPYPLRVDTTAFVHQCIYNLSFCRVCVKGSIVVFVLFTKACRQKMWQPYVSGRYVTTVSHASPVRHNCRQQCRVSAAQLLNTSGRYKIILSCFYEDNQILAFMFSKSRARLHSMGKRETTSQFIIKKRIFINLFLILLN